MSLTYKLILFGLIVWGGIGRADSKDDKAFLDTVDKLIAEGKLKPKEPLRARPGSLMDTPEGRRAMLFEVRHCRKVFERVGYTKRCAPILRDAELKERFYPEEIDDETTD